MTDPIGGWTPEPGALVFLDQPNPIVMGFTEDEAIAFLKGNTIATMEDSGVLVASAEVQTGAMIAFIPSTADLVDIVLEDGESFEQLHTTAYYLGDAEDIPEEVQREIHEAIQDLADHQPVIEGNLFGFSVWNPGAENECAVADVGGEDLENAHDVISELLDDMDFPYPDQHDPWRPHITLKYQEDAVEVLTPEVMAKTGLIIYDRIRVAFAGVVTDYPLSEHIVASIAFHLAGKHNQKAHGRGGLAEHASDGEIRAAQKLNKGKRLDLDDPTESGIAGGLDYYTSKESAGDALRWTANSAPESQDGLGALARTVAAAPPNAPTLYRGMHGVDPKHIPTKGDVFDLAPTSFTRSQTVAEQFATPTEFETKLPVVLTKVKKNSRALRVDQYSRFKDEKEHVAMGRYKVTDHKISNKVIKHKDGVSRTVTFHEIELEQVDPDVVSLSRIVDVTTGPPPGIGPMLGDNPWG